MSVAMSLNPSSDRGLGEEVTISEVESVYGSLASVSSLAVGGRYRLLPLDRSKAEIRLLQLLPGRREDPVECKLYLASRHDEPAYTALSYTWGDHRNVKRITVNGLTWLATENLCTALENIRDEQEPLILWVDAICIDQKNNDEKSWHVQEMQRTFSEARDVLVWLGSAADNDRAMSMVRQIGESALSLGPEDTIWGDPAHARVVDLYDKAAKGLPVAATATAATADDDDDDDDQLANLITNINSQNKSGLYFPEPASIRLFGQPWWSRTWVAQELAVSKEVTFAYGTQRVPQRILAIAAQLYIHCLAQGKDTGEDDVTEARAQIPIITVRDDGSAVAQEVRQLPREPGNDGEGPQSQLRFIDDCSLPDNLLRDRIYVQFTIRWAYLNYAKTGGLPLVFLLSSIFTYASTCVLQASDPRDYVFGLLGLASDSSELGILPDYSRSIEHTFTTLARCLIKHGHLICLSWCRTKGSRRSLPSWAPDLSQKVHRPFQWIVRSRDADEFVMEPTYGASRSFDAPPETMEVDSSERRLLHLWGVQVDSIEYSGVSFEELYRRSRPGPKQVTLTCIRWLQELRTLLESLDSEGGEEKHMDAVWRTSVADTEMTLSWEKFRIAGELTDLQKELYRARFPFDRMSDEARLDRHFYLMDLTNAQRRPFITSKGYVGLGPAELRPGDNVAIFCGAQMPHVLRVWQGQTKLVGDAYVYKLMDGETRGEASDLTLFEVF